MGARIPARLQQRRMHTPAEVALGDASDFLGKPDNWHQAAKHPDEALTPDEAPTPDHAPSGQTP